MRSSPTIAKKASGSACALLSPLLSLLLSILISSRLILYHIKRHYKLTCTTQRLSERIQGVKEQVKGVITRDPELKHRGKERMTGELKRKQKEEVRLFCFRRKDAIRGV